MSPTSPQETLRDFQLFIQKDAVTTVPDWHLANALIVIPEGSGDWRHARKRPFASVVALLPREVIAAKPRPCLNVFVARDGVYEFSDGLMAIRDECPYFTTDVAWPELFAALRRDHKAWWPLSRPKNGCPPYAEVKAWHEGDLPWQLPEGALDNGTALSALAILRAWNHWEKANATWMERAMTMAKLASASKRPDALRTVGAQDSALQNLVKFCGELGLKKNQTTDFKTPYEALKLCLVGAHKLSERTAG